MFAFSADQENLDFWLMTAKIYLQASEKNKEGKSIAYLTDPLDNAKKNCERDEK